MDYIKLAEEFLYNALMLRKCGSHKQISESMQGETFVLHYIAFNEGNILPSEISNQIGVSASRIAATLNSLENKGLITRKIDVSDRRRILVELTSKGKERAEKSFQIVLRSTAEMLSTLGEYDSKEYVRICGRLAEITPKDFE